MQTIDIRIKGMHCGGCEQIVRHVLEQEPGVKGCTVSHREGRARVAFDAAGTNAERLTEVLCSAGYPAAVVTDGAS